MRYTKQLTSLLLVICCLAATACTIVDKPDAAHDSPSQVYAEQAFDFAHYQSIRELRSVADGSLICVGYDSQAHCETVIKFGKDSVISEAIAIATDASEQIPWCQYGITQTGEVYTCERLASRDDARAVLRRIDAQGNKTDEIILDQPNAQPNVQANSDLFSNYPSSIGIDKDANLVYEGTHVSINIYDLLTGELKKSIQHDEYDNMNFAVMENGFICTSTCDYSKNNSTLHCYNPLTGETKWTLEYAAQLEKLMYCASDGKLYARAGRKVVCFDETGQERTLLELSDFSVLSPSSTLDALVVGANESVYCLLYEQQTNLERKIDEREKELDAIEAALKENPNASANDFFVKPPGYIFTPDAMKGVRLALTDAKTIQPPKELRVSIMQEDSQITALASAFHAANPGIRVKFEEMIPPSDFQQNDVDFGELIKRVNTQVISGKAADIIMLTNLPFEAYSEKNVLEDLLPYMENDPDFNIGDYRQNILGAFMRGGKLFALPTSFSVPIIVSRQETFSQDELTTQAYFDKLFALDGNISAYYTRDASKLFSKLFTSSISQFMDESGNVDLNTPEFITFLENIKHADAIFKRMPEDQQTTFNFRGVLASSILIPIYEQNEKLIMDFSDINSYNDAMIFNQQFGHGYKLRFMPSLRLPNAKGFSSENIFGINRASKEKDAAWQFLKFLVSENIQASDYSFSEFPVNRKASDKLLNMHLRSAAVILREHALSQHTGAGAMFSSKADSDIFIDSQISTADAETFEALLSQADTLLDADSAILAIALEEVEPFLGGLKTARETAEILQSRLSMYVSERQ